MHWTQAAAFALSALVATSAYAQDAADPAEDKAADAAEALQRGNKLAAAGKLADAVPYYEKAIRLDGVNQELAYYNLAEVQRSRGNCPGAVVAYQLYASVVGSAEARKEADEGIANCKTDTYATLELVADPKARAEIRINGMPASNSGTFGPLILPPETYEIEMSAPDHHPHQQALKLAAEPVKLAQKLKKMTFFGTITVTVDVPDAKVRVFEGPSDDTNELYSGTKADKVKVREGRHFIEVTAEGYNRWIRNVSVGRDVDAEVSVSLKRAVPNEIREKK